VASLQRGPNGSFARGIGAFLWDFEVSIGAALRNASMSCSIGESLPRRKLRKGKLISVATTGLNGLRCEFPKLLKVQEH
jgi:hypothetical protein